MRVGDFNWNSPSLIRAGLLPVTQQGSQTLLGFAVDSGVGSLTDFGGHREQHDGDALDTALREYGEESFFLFGLLTRKDVQDCYVLEGDDTAEILLPVPPTIVEYSARFLELVATDPNSEAQALVWLTIEQVMLAISQPNMSFRGTKIFHMYYRIRDTLRRHKDFLWQLNEKIFQPESESCLSPLSDCY